MGRRNAHTSHERRNFHQRLSLHTDRKRFPHSRTVFQDREPALPWWKIILRIDVTGKCGETERHWSIPATTSLGWREDDFIGNQYRRTYEDIEPRVDGCKSESFKVR